MTGLFAQNDITVRGRVLDTGGRPVIGAAVLMPGTTIGTATDEEGNFMLSVPRGTTLEISSIGYETVTLTATATMNITLREDTQELDETVVVGYGTQKKASLTSAISNIRGEELLATKQHDVVASLQGKVPGLLIRQPRRLRYGSQPARLRRTDRRDRRCQKNHAAEIGMVEYGVFQQFVSRFGSAQSGRH